MASSRQIQVMKLRVMEKLDDIFSQQKTIIATISDMSSQVKKNADKLLKSQNNEVTVSDFVNVLQDLERCFNNLIAISATTDDLFSLNNPTSNSLVRSQNPLALDSLPEYQVKWSNQDIPEYHPPQRTTSNLDTSFSRFSSTVESISRQQIPCNTQNYSDNSWTTNQYISGDNNSINFHSSQRVELCEQIASVNVTNPTVDAAFTAVQMESIPQQKWANLNSDSDPKSMPNETSLSRIPVKDIASLPNIISVPPFSSKSLFIKEPYGLGPALKCQEVTSVTNIQVCETVTPYCFWVQLSSSVHLLQELTSEINLFISSSKYNTNVNYGITCPCVGMTCIAPFMDGSYYRARVLSVSESQYPDSSDTEVNVLYVDYGNMDFIPSSSLMKMPLKLSKFPTQAVCCALARVMPNEIDEDWSAHCSEVFHNMVFCKDLVCNPAFGDNFIPQIVDLYLVESTSPLTLEELEMRPESKVSSILIEQELAQPIMESYQLQKIYEILKNWVLFKSCFSPNEPLHLLVKENSPKLSTSSIQKDFESHHQSHQVVKESTSLNIQLPVSTQRVATSPQGAQSRAFSEKNNLLCSSDVILEPSQLHSNSKHSPQVTALMDNSVPDFENGSMNSNSQTVISYNQVIDAAIENRITSSASECGGELSGSMENLNSDDLSATTLSQQSIHSISSKNSSSSDLEFVDAVSELDGFHAVMISQVESPSSFYIHHITEEISHQLETLVHDLNADFHCLMPSELIELRSELIIDNGKLCCAYLADEQLYYRGLIIEHKTDLSAGILVKVFYVDFGNSDWLNCDKIYPLPMQYSRIPALAQLCSLAYVRPQKSDWPDGVKAAFKNMIKTKETYFIKIVAGSSTLEIPSLANYEKGPVKVLMTNYDGSADYQSDHRNKKTEICLNYELIDLDHADLDIDNFESTDLVEWDPMLEDFDSRRNQYGVNIDDAEIAAVGFKVKDEVRICKFYRDGRRCWLGKRCPYKHIRLEKDCLTVDKRLAVCDVGLLGQIELPRVGSLVGVEVSAICSPAQFYVIFPWGIESVKNLNCMPVCPNQEETLPDLQESLQLHCKKLLPRTEENLLWTIGELVIAQAPNDEQWYRARISEVSDTMNIVKVFFVDFGNVQWIAEKDIQPIQPEFVHLPHQAVECCLDGIVSASNDGLWTQETRDYFLKLVDDVVLVAHVKSIVCERLYISLYNTSKEKDLNIGEELVKAGVGCKLRSKPKPSMKSSVNMRDQSESTKNVILIPG